ncbi:MAG: dipeptidase [Chlamydiales bacterium]
MKTPVVDLHCDLLLYLQMREERTPFDPLSRASHGQMEEGGVKLQTLAIFTYPKKGSVESARKQVEIFTQLPQRYKEQFAFFSGSTPLTHTSQLVEIVPAFENASGFCEEEEPLERGLARLQYLHATLKRILYISLTWDGENRFGGGNGTQIGLKDDGKQLLRWMHGKKIAVDLSHTSDQLAHGILSFIDQHALDIPVIASHSNFRSVTEAARNLPDEIAKEVIRRQGVIGFNFFSPFLGQSDSKNILKHLEHGLKLGAEKALSFGADFFCDVDFPSIKEKYKTDIFFSDDFANSSKYPHVLAMFQSQMGLSPEHLNAIASNNAEAFMKRMWGDSFLSKVLSIPETPRESAEKTVTK